MIESRSSRGPRRAGHLPQRGERLLRSPNEGARPSRPCDDRWSGRDDLGGRMDHGQRRVGQRPHAWPAIQGAVPPPTSIEGHREVSRLRDGPRNRPASTRGTRPDLRREGIRHNRGGARAPQGGDGIGPVRAKLITDAWAEQKVVRESMTFLHANGVGTARAVRIYKTYGCGRDTGDEQQSVPTARDVRDDVREIPAVAAQRRRSFAPSAGSTLAMRQSGFGGTVLAHVCC